MNALILRVEHNDVLGWSFYVCDEAENSVLTSTKYYPTFWEAYVDLRTIRALLSEF